MGLKIACLTLTWLASPGLGAFLLSGKKNESKKKTASLKVACWSICTMQDSEGRPQRRSTPVARELARLDIDIPALNEVRFVKQGSLTEDGSGYAPFWSGMDKDERRLSAVGFMLKLPVPGNCRTCQLVIQTASCPYDSQSRTASLLLSSVCTHQICWAKLD